MNAPSTADLVAALGPLADKSPGKVYTSAQLLPTYNAWAESQGRDTLTAQTLGAAMSRETTVERGVRHHAAQWKLTRAGLECRNWHQ